MKKATYISKDIDRLKERIEQLESEVMRVTARIAAAPAQTSRDNYLKEILIDLKTKMQNKLAQLTEQKAMIEEYLLYVDDNLLRMILSYRYVDLLSWREVAQKVGGDNTEESVKKQAYRFFEKE